MRQLFFESDSQFWFETVRVLGATAYGGADVGEVVTAAEKIADGDYDSWHDAWLELADRVAGEAQAALDKGHRVSARDGFLRASNYYRSAEFFMHGDPPDPRHEALYNRSVECFRAAGALFDPPVEPVEVPYEGGSLPGYLYRVDDSGTPRPTLIVHSGFDGTAEEMHFFTNAAAVERGYNVLAFDGPGQPGPRHRDGLVFRPDWENVVTPVVDFLVGRPEVDASRIALLGLSLGGILAPRAAAFENRLAALIARDGIYDSGDGVTAMVGGSREEAEARLRADEDADLDAVFEQAMAEPVMRWGINHGLYTLGLKTPRQVFAAWLDYSLRDGVAEKISCPTLVCVVENDSFFASQPEALYEHLTCEKTLLRFTAEEGADEHCQPAAQRTANARIFDWLDEALA